MILDSIIEELYEAWCPSQYPGPIPDHLKTNPARAYGLFTFELGLKLGLQLAVGALHEDYPLE